MLNKIQTKTLTEDQIVDGITNGELYPNYIPAKNKTEKVCIALIKHNSENIQFIPVDKLTNSLCHMAVENAKSYPYSCIMKYIPDKFKTLSLINKAISKKFIVSPYVPAHLALQQIYTNAISENPFNLIGTPERFLNEELCLLAVSIYGILLEFVPESIINKTICLEAVKQDGLAVQYVPMSILNTGHKYEIYLTAVTENINACNYIDSRVIVEGFKLLYERNK
jgi:Domain of unknown function (DUF4116)